MLLFVATMAVPRLLVQLVKVGVVMFAGPSPDEGVVAEKEAFLQVIVTWMPLTVNEKTAPVVWVAVKLVLAGLMLSSVSPWANATPVASPTTTAVKLVASASFLLTSLMRVVISIVAMVVHSYPFADGTAPTG